MARKRRKFTWKQAERALDDGSTLTSEVLRLIDISGFLIRSFSIIHIDVNSQ